MLVVVKKGRKNKMPKKQEESNVSDAIRLELAKRGCKIFRSQVGLFYTQYRRAYTYSELKANQIYMGIVLMDMHFILNQKFQLKESLVMNKLNSYGAMKASRCLRRIRSFCRRCN
jgi:hypothetical protein